MHCTAQAELMPIESEKAASEGEGSSGEKKPVAPNYGGLVNSHNPSICAKFSQGLTLNRTQSPGPSS